MSNSCFRWPLTVYIEDTDAGGIVFYVNYLKFMERARTEYLRSEGFDKNYIFNADLMFVVHSVACEYIAPARLDDQLEVTAKLITLGASKMELEQLVYRQGELLCRGKVIIVCVDRQSMKPKRIPKAIRAALAE